MSNYAAAPCATAGSSATTHKVTTCVIVQRAVIIILRSNKKMAPLYRICDMNNPCLEGRVQSGYAAASPLSSAPKVLPSDLDEV